MIPAPTMLTAFPDFSNALQALGQEGLSGASDVLSTGSMRNAARYLLLPAQAQNTCELQASTSCLKPQFLSDGLAR